MPAGAQSELRARQGGVRSRRAGLTASSRSTWRMRLAAGLYDGKPHAEEMIRGEPTIPVAGAKVFRLHQLTGIKPPFAFDPAKPPASDKATVLKLLGPSFDYVIERLPKITPEQLDRTLADSLGEGGQR